MVVALKDLQFVTQPAQLSTRVCKGYHFFSVRLLILIGKRYLTVVTKPLFCTNNEFFVYMHSCSLPSLQEEGKKLFGGEGHKRRQREEVGLSIKVEDFSRWPKKFVGDLEGTACEKTSAMPLLPEFFSTFDCLPAKRYHETGNFYHFNMLG